MARPAEWLSMVSVMADIADAAPLIGYFALCLWVFGALALFVLWLIER